MRSALALALLLAVSTGSLRAETAGQRLTIVDAERLALQSNPQLRAVSVRARASEMTARAGISRMLPALSIVDEYQHWDSAYTFPFSVPGLPAANAREQDTHTFTAAANQPLLGLIRLVEDYRAQKQSAAATAAQLEVAQAAVRQAVRVGFLRHFESNALAEIARQSEKELLEQVTIAQAKLKAGVLTNADLLRVQVAAANAKQQELVARTQAAIARASILISIGASPDENVDLVEPAELLTSARAEPSSYKNTVERALNARPELRLSSLTVAASRHQERARLFSLLPEINLQAGYSHVDGQIFAPANAAFIGLKTTWQFWDWGATYFGYRAAHLQTDAAREDLQAQRRQVQNEVASDLLQSQSARSAVKLAEQSIESAAEAYRVTDALLKAGSATTTDLLESQAALSQARLNLVRAQYQLALAHVAILHSTGAE